jgi:hypothetical protein
VPGIAPQGWFLPFKRVSISTKAKRLDDNPAFSQVNIFVKKLG